MGRCNNRRTQQAAADLRHTPARARFSSSSSAAPAAARRRRGGRAPSTTKPNAVVEKIAKRVGLNNHRPTTTQQQNITSIPASSVRRRRRSPLDGVDIAKLETVKLSEESMQLITDLLKDLNVVVVGNDEHSVNENEERSGNDEDEKAVVVEIENEDALINDRNSKANNSLRPDYYSRRGGNTNTYSEYEDDGYEQPDGMAVAPHFQDDDAEWEGSIHPTNINGGAFADANREAIVKEDDGEGILQQQQQQNDPVFFYLTATLSFDKRTASKACRAVETWSAAASTTTKSSNDETTKTKATLSASANRLTDVMDWLCLHLTEKEISLGFQPNKAATSSSSKDPMNGNNSTTFLLAGTGRTKAIPHPSISVAKKLTEDAEWSHRARLEQRAVEFLKFGFHHGEIVRVLEEQQYIKKEPTNCPALEDSATLRLLLESLEREIIILPSDDEESGNDSVVVADDENEDADLDREQEQEALRAIYEDQFEVLEDCKSQSRYRIAIVPSEELVGIQGFPSSDTATSSVCDLHVFLRAGYPLRSTPLFLLHNPNLPWPLLRKINTNVMRQAKEAGLGAPVLFEAVTDLVETLPRMLEDYMKEQRAKEFEATQMRLRKEAGHDVDDGDSDYFDDDDDEVDDRQLSRRQRARLKGAEKAYDRDQKEQQNEERRRKLQVERLERIKGEDKDIRSSMAERAILRRQQEKLDEELQKITRSAMSAAFNRGEGVEEARAAAKRAELEYSKAHDMDDNKFSDKDGEQNASDEGGDLLQQNAGNEPEYDDDDYQQAHNTNATPTTMAFMDRLRRMYANAAREKGGYKLNEPAIVGENGNFSKDDEEEKEKLPCPIAAPVGDLATIMQDHVIAVQKDQPWLVAPEARKPDAQIEMEPIATSDALTQRQKDINQRLQRELDRSQKYPSKQVQRIREQTEQLPAFQMRDTIVSTIRENQVTLISGATGSGKTTVVPGLLLNDMIISGIGHEANIWVCQPRRLSAIGVSERIASERGEKVGETCGYSIKLERKCSKKTRITLCTTGILLRRLQGDPDLATISHLILDEVHERDINSDFAMIILKELLKRRKSLKLILMSATFDKDIFAHYFGDCATVSIPGRAHPVQEYRLEDALQLTGYEIQEGSDYALKENSGKPTGRMSKSALKKLYYPKYDSKTIHSLSIVDESVINYELMAELVEHISRNGEDGAILMFLPGMAEITKTIDELRKKEFFQSDEQVLIYPLHSSLSTSEQTQVFEVPPKNIRKIVVSTNICETSITVPDVVYVIDCGRVKENRRDEVKETTALVECWISKASAQQRRGRAGRVRPGIAYHLFSSHTYDSELQEYQLPEMLRVGVEELALQILLLDLGQPTIFLAKALSPPSAVAMKNALMLLEELGAVECQWQSASVDESETCDSLADTSAELTALGYHLASIPTEPRIAKLIIYGALFGCVESALTIAASMSSKNPFLSPFGNREAADEARRNFSIEDSDHLTVLEAFNRWADLRRTKGDRATNSFLRDNFLSRMTLFQMDELRKQFASLLVDIGFLPKGFKLERTTRGSIQNTSTNIANANNGNRSLLKALLCSGLYPNIIRAPECLVNGVSKQEAGELPFQSRRKGEVYLHPCTLLFSAKQLGYRYACFREIIQTRKLYVRDATVVSPFALLLFGGALRVYHKEGVISVDEWLKFKIAAKPATLIKHLRSQMESMLLKKILDPEDDVTLTPEAKALIKSISILLEREMVDQKGDAGRNDGAEIVRPWNGSAESEKQGRGRSRGRGRGRANGGRGKSQGRGRGRN